MPDTETIEKNLGKMVMKYRLKGLACTLGIAVGGLFKKVFSPLTSLSFRRKLYKLIESANFFELLGETEKAIELYEKAYSIYPDAGNICLSLARNYLRLFKFDLVRKFAAECLEYDPLNPECNLYMGVACFYLGELERAMKYLKIARKLLPETSRKKAQASEYLGDCFYKAGNVKKAVEVYVESATCGSSEARDKLEGIGIEFYEKGELKDSLEVFHKLVKINPKDHRAWNNLGVVFCAFGDQSNAFLCFRESLNLCPGYKEALKNLEKLGEMAGGM